MARKLVGNNFWIVSPPPQKKNRVPKNKFCQKLKNSNLFEIVWNGEKLGQKWFFEDFLDFLAAPPPPLIFFGGAYKFVVKN